MYSAFQEEGAHHFYLSLHWCVCQAKVRKINKYYMGKQSKQFGDRTLTYVKVIKDQ